MAYVGNTPFTAAFQTDTFSGNGTTTAFTMSVAPANTTSVIVAITGVLQDPSTYSVSGTTLTFSAAPPTGTSNISVRFLGLPASGVTTTAYRTVTDTTATAGQTTFSIPSYTVGYISVFRNGSLLAGSDYTATSGTSVVLANAASAGDTITTESFYVSSVLNAFPTTGGTLSGQVTVNSATGQKPLIAQVNGTEVFEVDASGNVGIGTSSPGATLDLRGTYRQVQASDAQVLGSVTQFNLQRNSNDSRLCFGYTTSNSAWNITASYGSTGAYAPLAFSTSDTERMRIDTSGNLLVGINNSALGALTVGKAAPSAPYGQICAFSPTAGDSNISGMSIVKYASDTTTAQVMIRFLIGQGANGQGQINANGANTVAFGSYSDSRLKENIVDLPSQLGNIMALRPVEYDYIESMGGGHQIGFVAQEVQAIYPDLVGENEDGMLTLTDMNKNDARLIKAIQEMKAIIDTQASTITQLQADVAALKGNA